MKRSEKRILTTHTGSLPRPEGLVEMLGAVSRGDAVDEAALASAAREATGDVVRAQAQAGVDVINGGGAAAHQLLNLRIAAHVRVRRWVDAAGTTRPDRVSVGASSPCRQPDAGRPNVRRATVLRPAGRC